MIRNSSYFQFPIEGCCGRGAASCSENGPCLDYVAAIRSVVLSLGGHWFPYKTQDWFWIVSQLEECENAK
jgi:hypothetical protein